MVTGIESQLMESAGGQFWASMLVVLVLFILGVTTILVNMVVRTVPKQLDAIATQSKEDRIAMCNQVKELIQTLKETSRCTNDFLIAHNEQAKQILNNVCEIKGKMNI